MVSTDEAFEAGVDDGAAIAELEEIVARQREAQLTDPSPSLDERRELLGALAAMLLGHRVEIQDVLMADFGAHPRQAADLIEVLGPAARAAYAAEHLEGLLIPGGRPAHDGHFRYRTAVL